MCYTSLSVADILNQVIYKKTSISLLFIQENVAYDNKKLQTTVPCTLEDGGFVITSILNCET